MPWQHRSDNGSERHDGRPAMMRTLLLVSAVCALAALGPSAAPAQDRCSRARAYTDWREYDAALPLLDSIGTDSLAQALKCRILARQRKYQRLLMEATQAAILWPGTDCGRAAGWQLAYAQEQLGQYQDAIAAYRAAADSDSALIRYASFRISRCQTKLRAATARTSRRGKRRRDKGDDLFRPAVAQRASASSSEDNVRAIAPPPQGPRPYALKLAAKYVKRRSYDRARAVLADFVRCRPASGWRGEAAYQIAKCWERQGRNEQALTAYRRAAEGTPASAWADDALFRAGWCQLKLNDTTAALESWQALDAAFPSSDCCSAAWYWSGKLYSQRGDTARARECQASLVRRYPYSFYGLKAQHTFDDTAAAALDGTAALGIGKHPAPDSCGILRDPVFRLGAALARYGLCDDAGSVLSRLEDPYRHDAASLYHLARACAQCGQDERAIDIAQRALRLHGGVRPAELLDIMYPLRYLATIRRVSDSARLDPAMVLAVIHKESKFDERCLSWAGARGLMQVMPRTGRLLAGDKKFTRDRLFDPLISIRLGTKFLAGMLREFPGSMIHALAAYNAGPARVHAWLHDRNSRRDDDYFLEEIFVPETKRYIQVVMENYYIYRLLLRGEPGS